MNKYNTLRHKNQEIFSSEVINFFQELSDGKKSILNELFFYSNCYVTVSPSQGAIGVRAGISREYVNKTLSLLEQRGLIKKKYQHRRPCIYYLHPQFYVFEVRKKLWDIFPAMRWLPKHNTLLFLMMTVSGIFSFRSELFTPSLYKYKESIKPHTIRSVLERDYLQVERYTPPSGLGTPP